jgi:hypothetical protein
VNKIVDPKMPQADRDKMIAMLEARTTLLEQKIAILSAPRPKKLQRGKPFRSPTGGMPVPVPEADPEVLAIRRLEDLPKRALPHGIGEPPMGISETAYEAHMSRTLGKLQRIAPQTHKEVVAFTDGLFSDVRSAQQQTEEERKKSTYAQRYYDRGEEIEKMFDLIEHTPGQVFRGIGGLTREVIDQLMVQDEIDMLGTASSSRSSAKAVSFMRTKNGPYKALFVLHQRSGVAIEKSSDYSTEREVLISRRARFRVLARHVSDESKDELIIEVEEIEGPAIQKRDASMKMKAPGPNKLPPKVLPPGLPKTGTYKGKTIDLLEALATLSPRELAAVIVQFPDGPSQPWKHGDYAIGEDGKVYL